MKKLFFSFQAQGRFSHAPSGLDEKAEETQRRRNAITLRILGILLLCLAGFAAWQTNGFDSGPSRYVQKRLVYTKCLFEKTVRYRGAGNKVIVLICKDGRYTMEEGVWSRHWKGQSLADALDGGGAVQVWLHPDYPRALRGITGGKVEIPLEWGIQYDQRNMLVARWVAGICVFGALGMLFFPKSRL